MNKNSTDYILYLQFHQNLFVLQVKFIYFIKYIYIVGKKV